MSTPNSTSLKRPLPTSSSSAQANPSTPANTTSGTTPRSIATPNAHPPGFRSPTTTRTTLGKSPKPPTGTPSAAKASLATGGTNSAANTPQLSSGHASKQLPPSSSGLSQGSPAALVATPGLSAGTAGGFGSSPGIDALGMAMSISSMGVAMGLSASSLGLGVNMNLATGSSLGPGKMGDDERRRRLEAVLAALGQRTGHVSQAGLEQLGKRLGLDLAWDLFPDLKVGNGRMLSLSGVSSMQVDVEFDDKQAQTDSVARVALTYHGLSEPVEAGAHPASRILHRDVVPAKGQAAITLTLDRFAANLERLSRLDKLSVPGANCFEAVNGVFESLRTLFEHEKKTARALFGDDADQESIDREVMCKKSGRPRMHVRRHVGMQLDYWRQRHLIPSGDRKQEPVSSVVIKTEVETPMAMDIEGAHQQPTMQSNDDNDQDDDEGETTYSLSIECEHSPPENIYQTIRVSSHWLSEHISRRPSEVESALAALDPLPSSAATSEALAAPELQPDWQDPPFPHDPTLLSAAGGAPNADVKPSQARFVAKFNPPLLVPLRIAIPIYASVGVDISHQGSSVAWHSSILDCPDAPLPAAGSPFRMTTSRSISRPRDPVSGGASSSSIEAKKLQLQLAIPRAEPARWLDSIPFVHPKQLVALLPVLRQYALLGSLLRSSFIVPPLSSSPTEENAAPQTNGRTTSSDAAVDLDTLMADDDDDNGDGLSSVQGAASFHLRTDAPLGPRFAAALPAKSGVAYADVDILPGGAFSVSGLDIVGRGSAADASQDTAAAAAAQREKIEAQTRGLVRGLAVAEDLGVWAAWVGSVL